MDGDRRTTPRIVRWRMMTLWLALAAAGCETPTMVPGGSPTSGGTVVTEGSSVAAQKAAIAALKTRLGPRAATLDRTVAARLSPDLDYIPVGSLVPVSRDHAGTGTRSAAGGPASLDVVSNPDYLRSSISGWADEGGTGYYVGGYMVNEGGAIVGVEVNGYGDMIGFPYYKVFLEAGSKVNAHQYFDIWSNSCGRGEHNSIGGTGRVGATQLVSNGFYLPPTLYIWGPDQRSLFSECNRGCPVQQIENDFYDPLDPYDDGPSTGCTGPGGGGSGDERNPTDMPTLHCVGNITVVETWYPDGSTSVLYDVSDAVCEWT